MLGRIEFLLSQGDPSPLARAGAVARRDGAIDRRVCRSGTIQLRLGVAQTNLRHDERGVRA